MDVEPKVLTIADLDRMDAEDEARERFRWAVESGLLQIELPHEAS